MSDKHSINVVSQRVQKTKKEIEDLKAELEKLINCGIKRKEDEKKEKPITIKNDIKEIHPKSNGITINQKKASNTNGTSNLKGNINTTSVSNSRGRSLLTTRRWLTVSKGNPSCEASPTKKVRRYDPEEARDYIKKKRKERAMEKMSIKNNINVKDDATKEKLKELHKKSLDLVTKNVQMKRERSLSKEANKNAIITCNVNFTRGISKENDTENNQNTEKPKQAEIDPIQTKAAIKIQTFYRGYKDRKSYKEMMAKRKTDERVCPKEMNDVKPDWLNVNSTPVNPYNFINTVKRKLNLAIKECSDVGVQNSFMQEIEDGSCIIRKTKEDIKELFEHTIAKNVCTRSKSKEIIVSDSDTSKNIPEIASETSSTIFDQSKLTLPQLKSESQKTNFHDSIISSNKSRYNQVPIKSYESSLINKTRDEYLREFLDYMKDYGKTPKKTDNSKGDSKTCNTSTTASFIRSGTSLANSAKISSIASVTNRTKTDDTVSSVNSTIHGSVKVFKSSIETENVQTSIREDSIPIALEDDAELTHEISVNDISSVPSLVPPNVKLSSTSSQGLISRRGNVHSLKHVEKRTLETTGNTNEIHLKFEAELHLLNDFNESLRQFMAVDKTLLELQNKNSNKVILHTRDTQTSFASKSSSFNDVDEVDLSSKIDDMNVGLSPSLSILEKLNDMSKYNGSTTISSFIDNENKLSNSSSTNDLNLINDESSIITGNITFKDSNGKGDTSRALVTSSEELLNDNSAPKQLQLNDRNVDINLFDQFIKDEDARLENLKTILKIREKTLLDRTKAELAWLEIQKKHLRETGHLHEVSLVKKKQRGILLKLQQERHEMQRLKQMQKIASKERKIILKQQRNLIKGQLATNKMMTTTKIKKNAQDQQQRRLSGPLKVYNIKTFETSIISKQNSSMTEEIISLTSRTQSLAAFTNSDNDDGYNKTVEIVDDEEVSNRTDKRRKESSIVKDPDHIKRSLLMREEGLQRRRKAAEELLQWHQRLVEEEKKIHELEMTANKIIQDISNNKRNYLQDSLVPVNALLWNNNIMTTKNTVRGNEDNNKQEKDEFKSNKSDTNNIQMQVTHSSDNSVVIVTNKVSEDGSSSVNDSYSLDFNAEKDVTMACVTSSLHQIKETLSNISHEISEIQELSISNSSKLIPTSDKLTGSSVISLLEGEQNEIVTNVTSETESVTENKLEIEETTRNSNDGSLSEIKEIEAIPKSTSSFQLSSSFESIMKDDLQTKPALSIVSRNIENSIVNTEPLSEEEIGESLKEEQATSATIHGNVTQPSIEIKLLNMKVDQPSTVSETISVDEVLPESTQIEKNKEIIEHERVSEEDDVEEFISESELISESKESSQDLKTPEELHSEVGNESEIMSVLSIESVRDMEPEIGAENEKCEDLIEDIKSSELASAVSDKKFSEKVQNNDFGYFLDERQSPVNNQNLQSIESIVTSSDLQSDIEIKTSQNLSVSEDLKSSMRISAMVDNEIDVKNLSTSAECIDDNTSEGGENTRSDESRNDEQLKDSYDFQQEEKDDTRSFERDDHNHSSTDLKNRPTENGSIESVKLKETTETAGDEAILVKRKDEETVDGEETMSSSDERLDLSYGIVQEKIDTSSSSNNSNIDDSTIAKTEERSLDELRVDVKKRMSEILADNNSYKTENSPRLQDIYCTTYDLNSPNGSPEPTLSDLEPLNKEMLSAKFGDEAEELLKKQLAIEQEIKQLEQQQKEHIPYMYVREIPNKPPPPYTPPSNLSTGSSSTTVAMTLPSNPATIDSIIDHISDLLYEANKNKRLKIIEYTDNDLRYLTDDNNITKSCCDLIFDLSKEIAIEYYKQFQYADMDNNKPSWMIESRKYNEYLFRKKIDKNGLRSYLKKNVRQILGCNVKPNSENENDDRRNSNTAILKWSHKKRDHVDELLIIESQNDEAQWTNYDYDELIVKNDLSNDILNILIGDTANVLKNILTKKSKNQ